MKKTKNHLSLMLITIMIGMGNLKTNAQAPDIQWQETLGGTSYDIGSYHDGIQQTSDGGYIFAGVTGSNDGNVSGNHGADDLWIVKLNAGGSIQWQKALGGSFNEENASIQQTTDGGYIVGGATSSNDGDVSGDVLHNPPGSTSDGWVVKLDASGNIQWQKNYGGPGGSTSVSDIRQTSDGSYIMVANINNLYDGGDITGGHGFGGSGADTWVVKLNATGSIQWQHALGGTYNDGPQSIQQTSDGGYIVAATTSSNDGDVSGNHSYTASGNPPYDFWIVKLNATGNITWQKCLGGSGDDRYPQVEATNDGGYIVVGSTDSNDGDVSGNNGGIDTWIVKLDAGGNITWQECLGGASDERGSSIQQTSDGGYIVGGDGLGAVKLNAIGVIQWQKPLSGRFGRSIEQTTDGGYIVASTVVVNDFNYDVYLVKLASSCDISVSVGQDESTFFGYSGDQQVTRTAIVSGGIAPYTYSWTIGRALKCNQITSAGDEIFSGGTCTNTACPTNGTLTGIAACSGSATVTVRLMDTTNVCVTVTDANNCTATDCFLVMAEDVRCFAGNSGNYKIKVCHHTNSNTNPWVQLCIADNAVAAHLANNQGDYLGNCSSREASIAEDMPDWYVDLVPNPAHDKFTVEFPSEKAQLIQMNLLDVAGRKILSESFVSIGGINSKVVDIRKIIPGIYFLELSSPLVSKKIKLVVE